jgi:zinc protease
MGQAMEIGQWVMSDLPAQGIEQQFEAVLQGIQRVTSQDIQRVIQTYLTDDRLTVATLIPQPLDVAQAKKQAQAKQARHTH